MARLLSHSSAGSPFISYCLSTCLPFPYVPHNGQALAYGPYQTLVHPILVDARVFFSVLPINRNSCPTGNMCSGQCRITRRTSEIKVSYLIAKFHDFHSKMSKSGVKNLKTFKVFEVQNFSDKNHLHLKNTKYQFATFLLSTLLLHEK